MLELRHLRLITALAETGSITHAASRLHLTQSALSHQLAALEHYFDMPLLERQQRPLNLTPAGQALLELAHTVLPAVEQTRQAISRLQHNAQQRSLRIALECHTCYDWLMPAMDAYRERHAEVEQDLVSGFHTEPLALLRSNQADIVIVSERKRQSGIAYLPLFAYEIVALMAHGHRLTPRPFLDAADFADETLITYPVPDRMLDLIRRVLRPAGVNPPRRTAELTVAILQLVASRRGIAALPRWAVQGYLERNYVESRSIGKKGLWSQLYAAVRTTELELHREFADLLTETAFAYLSNIKQITAEPGNQQQS